MCDNKRNSFLNTCTYTNVLQCKNSLLEHKARAKWWLLIFTLQLGGQFSEGVLITDAS